MGRRSGMGRVPPQHAVAKWNRLDIGHTFLPITPAWSVGRASMLSIKIGGTACATPPYKTRRFFHLNAIMAFQNQLSMTFVKKVVEDLTASLVGMSPAVAFILARSPAMEAFASSRSSSSVTRVECR